MSDDPYKRQFASFLQKLCDPYKAAYKLFPNDNKTALRVAHEWPNDRTVVDYLNEKALSLPDDEGLPTKADLARSVWDRMSERGIEDADFVKLAKLYGEVRGFIEKPAASNVNVTNTSNPVMVLQHKGDDDQWADGLLEHQDNLADESTEKN